MANGGAGGVFRALVGVVAVGLIGYNTWENARLRSEVNALKRKNGMATSPSAHPVKPGAASSKTHAPDGAAALFGEARRHAERAEALLRMKKYDAAQREIALAAESAKRASRGAQGGTENAMRGLESALRRLSNDTGRLWERNAASSGGDGGKNGKTVSAGRKEGVHAETKNDKKP